MSFSVIYDEVVYIMISIKLQFGKDIDSVYYVCGVLDYNTVTWWRCDDGTITSYSGYPENVYDYLLHENEKKGEVGLKGSDSIVSILYIKESFSHPEYTRFVMGDQYTKILKTSRIYSLNLKFSKNIFEK